ncbi:MAG: DUF3717 domain-containing protein [Pseudomonadota bacterium]
MDIALNEMEDAINYWRLMRPSQGEESALSPEVNALAGVYALMIYEHAKAVSIDRLDDTVRALVNSWRDQRSR